MATATPNKPGTHRIVAVTDVTWQRLVLLRDADKLVERPTRLLGVTFGDKICWDYANVEQVSTLLPATGMMIAKINLPFQVLNELPEDAAWRRHSHIARVVIHGQYDSSAKTTVQSTIVCNETGATVHIVSSDYDRSIGDFLVDNAGFQSSQDVTHNKLNNDAVICDFDEVLMVGDAYTNLDFSPRFEPLPVSYETLNQRSD